MISAGMLRKGWANATMEAAGHVNDSPLFMAEYLLRFLRVAVLLGVWRMVFAGRGPVNGMGLNQALTYTLISEIFAEQFQARTAIEFIIWEGQIATQMLRPMGLVFGRVSEQPARWLLGFALCGLPLLAASPWLGVDPRPASTAAGLYFIPSLLLALSVAFALDFLFAGLFVAVNESVWAIDQLRTAVRIIMSGQILPLALMPWGVGRVFEWLPFAAMASAPLRIYTGTGAPVPLILIQCGWSIVLIPLALRLWRANREKLVSYGG